MFTLLWRTNTAREESQETATRSIVTHCTNARSTWTDSLWWGRWRKKFENVRNVASYSPGNRLIKNMFLDVKVGQKTDSLLMSYYLLSSYQVWIKWLRDTDVSLKRFGSGMSDFPSLFYLRFQPSPWNAGLPVPEIEPALWICVPRPCLLPLDSAILPLGGL